MLKLINGVVGAVCLVIVGSDVLAATQEYQLHREASIAAADGVTLSEAVSIAETHIGGRAVDAERQTVLGHNIWGVDVVSGHRKIRVWVDARNGNVDAMTPEGSSR